MIRTHNSSFETGAEYTQEELIEEFLPDKKIIVGSDMDGTMFNNDIGVLVFLEKLSDPTFWKFKTSRFKSLLLPIKYRRVFQEGATGSVSELDQRKCQFILNLWEDICDLYRRQREILSSNGPRIHIHTPIVNEFARKMLAFDRLLIEMERQLISRFKGELLMRTRFFADKGVQDVEELTKKVMAREIGDEDSEMDLAVHDDNRNEYNQRISAEDLEPIVYNRIVIINLHVAALIKQVFDRGAAVRVITTNIQNNALGAINNSDYSYLNHRRTISASSLRMNGDRFGSKMDGMPIFGERKVDIAREIEEAKKRKFKVALGDSFTNDSPMGKYALENGGVFVIVADDYEEARQKFNPIYEELGANGVGERIWYIEPTEIGEC